MTNNASIVTVQRLERNSSASFAASAQTRFAEQIGAAGKAVVYQWESGKRKPSRVF